MVQRSNANSISVAVVPPLVIATQFRLKGIVQGPVTQNI